MTQDDQRTPGESETPPGREDHLRCDSCGSYRYDADKYCACCGQRFKGGEG